MNDDDFLKSKGFWLTLGAGSLLINPGLLIPVAAAVAIYGAAKGTKAAVGAASRAIESSRAARRECERRRLAEEAFLQGAPERARVQREAEARDRLLRDDQRRRDQMRTRCQLLYFHYPALHAKRLPPERFHEFIQTQMGDDQPADVVEARGRDLQRLLLRIGERPAPPAATDEYLHWCREQLIVTASLPLDDRLKAETMTALQRSLTSTEQLLVTRKDQSETHTRMEVRIPELLREHEQRLATLRGLIETVDAATREDLELDRLVETEVTRFKRALLAVTAGRAAP